MNTSPNRFISFVLGEWAPNKVIFWLWKWVVLLVVLLPWSWLSSVLWNERSMWSTYADLLAFGTFAIIVGAVLFEKQLLPERLRQ